MSFFASSMKYVPIRLPTPREPECSMNHTRSASSRHTSMKWLPVPSVPSCFRLFDCRIVGCFATIRAKRGSRPPHACAAWGGASPHEPLSRRRG